MIEHDPNHPYLRRRTEYWLQSDAQRRSWGPFADEDAAWRYLFGRESSDEDRQQHKDAGWHVGPINKWPSAEWRDTEGDAVDVTHWAPLPAGTRG